VSVLLVKQVSSVAEESMTKSALVLGFVAVLSVPLAARASLLTGVLNFTGSTTISSGSIAFDNGNVFDINPADTQVGSFAVLGGTSGSIDNITNPPDATGVPLDVTDFITFAAAPNITITLTELLPGIDGAAGCTDTPPAAGQLCTPDVPVQSPLNLQNTSSTSASASFAILGIEVDSLTGDTVPITGEFTLPLADQNFQDLLSTIGADGAVTTSFSAQIATTSPGTAPPVPEPRTLILMVIGIGLVGLVRLRSARSS
jgi:hypothetical protein